MYALMSIYDEVTHAHWGTVAQGSTTAMVFRDDAVRQAFIDQLFIHHRMQKRSNYVVPLGDKIWQITLALPADRMGLLSVEPTVVSVLSVMDNLHLVAHDVAKRSTLPFEILLERAKRETGVLSQVNLARIAGELTPAERLELNFLQIWLCEPECLVVDRLFDSVDVDLPLRLVGLFQRRYPLRAICVLGQTLPLALGQLDTEAITL